MSKESFSSFEQYYLLQYIYYGDIRIAALLAGMVPALTLYLTHDFSIDSVCARRFHIAFALVVLLCGAASLVFLAVALCPLRRRARETPKSRKLLTHYVDISKETSNPDEYLRAFDDLSPDDLIREQVRHCHDMALILNKRMNWIIWGMYLAAVSIGLLFADLGLKYLGLYR